MPLPVWHLAQQRQIASNLRVRISEVVIRCHGADLGVQLFCSNSYTTFTPFDGAQTLQATERGLGIF